MRLVVAALVLTAALARADTSYQNFQTYQDGHGHDLVEKSANYLQPQTLPLRRAGNGLTGVLHRYLNPIRRQDIFGLFTGLGGPLGLLGILGLLIFTGLIFFAYYNAIFNFSGRGLDTDEWEVDHSVWMNQLQKDFEDSWSLN